MNTDLIEISQADDDDDSLLLNDAVSSLSSYATVDFSCSPLVRSNRTDEDTWQVRGSGEKENMSGGNKLTVERQKMKKKKKGFNLRKSLAWNHAFFTDEGVLDPTELSLLNGGLGNPGGEMLSAIDEGRESLSGEMEGDLNDLQTGNDILLKQLPSSSIKKGQKTTSNVVLTSVPGSCGKEKKSSSASAVKRKVLSAHDINRSASKRGGGASLPVPSTSLKRPSNLNTTKAVNKEPNVSKLSTVKSYQLVNSAANRISKTSVNLPKCNRKALPAINPTKNIMKATFTNMKSSTSNVRSGPAVKPILKSSIRPSRNVGKAVSQASTNEHNLTVNPTKTDVKSDSAVSVSALPPSGHDDRTGRLSVSFGANMRQAQPQAAKPSGLRMPSPSLRFFDQAKSGSSQGLLQKSTQLVRPAESGVCASKVGGLRPTLPPRNIPAMLHSGSSIVPTIELNSFEKLKSNLEVNNAQKVGVNIPCKSDEKMNGQQVNDVYDVGPQLPDIAKLAEPCKVENQDAKLKNSELLLPGACEQLNKDDSREAFAGSDLERTELVLSDEKMNEQQLNGVYDVGPQSPDVTKLAEPCMVENQDAELKYSKLLLPGACEQLKRDGARDAFTGSDIESAELVLSDRKMNQLQVNDVYDVGPQSPDVTELAEPCKVETEDAELKNSEFILPATCEQLNKDDAREAFTGSHLGSTELVLPETDNPNLTCHINDSVEVKGPSETKSMSRDEISLDTQSIDMNNSNNNLSDRMDYTEEQSAEHAKLTETVSRGVHSFSSMNSSMLEVNGLSETKSMTHGQICEDTQSIDMDICRDENNSEVNEDLPGEILGTYEQFHEQAELVETDSPEVCPISIMNSSLMPVNDDILEVADCSVQAKVCTPRKPEFSCSLPHCKDIEHLKGETTGSNNNLSCEVQQDAPVLCGDDNMVNGSGKNILRTSAADNPLSMIMEVYGDEESEEDGYQEADSCQAAQCVMWRDSDSCKSELKKMNNHLVTTDALSGMYAEGECSNTCMVIEEEKGLPFGDQHDNNAYSVKSVSSEETNSDNDESKSSCILPFFEKGYGAGMNGEVSQHVEIAPTVNDVNQVVQNIKHQLLEVSSLGLERTDGHNPLVKSQPVLVVNNSYEECTLGPQETYSSMLHNVCSTGREMGEEIQQSLEQDKMITTDCSHDTEQKNQNEDARGGLLFDDAGSLEDTLKAENVIISEMIAAGSTGSVVPHALCQVQRTEEASQLTVKETPIENSQAQLSIEDSLKAENVIISETIAAGATGSVVPHVFCQVQRTEEASKLTVEETPMENSLGQLSHESLLADRCNTGISSLVESAGCLMVPDNVPEQPEEQPLLENPDHMTGQIYEESHGLSSDSYLLPSEISTVEEDFASGGHGDVLGHSNSSTELETLNISSLQTPAMQGTALEVERETESMDDAMMISGSLEVESSVENVDLIIVGESEADGKHRSHEPLEFESSMNKECQDPSAENSIADKFDNETSATDIKQGGEGDVLDSKSLAVEDETLAVEESTHQSDLQYETENVTDMMISGSLEVESSAENVDIVMIGDCEADEKHGSHEPLEFESPMNNACQDPSADNSIAGKVDDDISSTDIMQGGEADLLDNKTSAVKDEILAVKETTHQSDLQYEMDNATEDKNVTASVKESVNEKRNAPVIKPPPNLVPFSDEWLAAFEAAGEEILTMKSGAVQNSPPDKSQPEPSPWSPVKRKNNQGIGPYDCTKYTNTGIPPSTSS